MLEAMASRCHRAAAYSTLARQRSGHTPRSSNSAALPLAPQAPDPSPNATIVNLSGSDFHRSILREPAKKREVRVDVFYFPWIGIPVFSWYCYNIPTAFPRSNPTNQTATRHIWHPKWWDVQYYGQDAVLSAIEREKDTCRLLVKLCSGIKNYQTYHYHELVPSFLARKERKKKNKRTGS